MILTEKETTAIKDLQTQEQSCIEKYRRYGGEAKDHELQSLFQRLEKEEETHYQSLGKVLSGTVPACNCNDSSGRSYSPKATYSSGSETEDKKNDCFLATDCIGTEKWYLPNTTQMYLSSQSQTFENYLQTSKLKNKIMLRCCTSIRP